jgi:hypothetical protein
MAEKYSAGTELTDLITLTGLERVFFFGVVIEMCKYSDPLIFTADSPFRTTLDVTESAQNKKQPK